MIIKLQNGDKFKVESDVKREARRKYKEYSLLSIGLKLKRNLSIASNFLKSGPNITNFGNAVSALFGGYSPENPDLHYGEVPGIGIKNFGNLVKTARVAREFNNVINNGLVKPVTLATSKIKLIANNTKQSRLISPGTYPWYRGPRFNINEIVNSDGTVNPRKAMLALHTVAKQFGKGAYKMEHRLENPEWHKEDPNTYEHTKRVALSAWKIPTPEGYTKLDLMIAALGHDFGKIISGDGHAQIGADLAKQVFPNLTNAQYTAIAEHMGTPKTPLGKATKAADIDNGRNVIRRSEDTGPKVLSNNLELYALRNNTRGGSKITVSDVYKSLAEAGKYKNSKGYKELVYRAQKEAEEMGLPFKSDLYIEVNKHLPSIKLSSRPEGKLGGYRRSTNTIELDPDLLNPTEGKYVPFHEGLHWLRVGTPEMNSPLYNRWKKNMNDDLAWREFYRSEEYKNLAYEDNAKAYARKKIKEALYEDADPYLSILGELLANGLEAGRAIGLKPFAEYPGYGKALEASNKARDYNKWLNDVKAGTTLEMLNFWKILTGNYLPAVSLPFLIPRKEDKK